MQQQSCAHKKGAAKQQISDLQLRYLVRPVVPSVSMCKEETLDPICTIVFSASSDSSIFSASLLDFPYEF